MTLCGAEDYDATDDDGVTLTYSASGGGYGSLRLSGDRRDGHG